MPVLVHAEDQNGPLTDTFSHLYGFDRIIMYSIVCKAHLLKCPCALSELKIQ
jgi:hypothetical protein